VGSPTQPQPAAEHHEETLTDAISRFERLGFTVEFFATDDRLLGCRGSDHAHDPSNMEIVHTVRFEGDSNPDDEMILLAMRCPDGHRGLYSAAFGPSTPVEDVDVLQVLAQRATRPEV